MSKTETIINELLTSGGETISIILTNASVLNVLELEKPPVTEQLLKDKEAELRTLLDEANKTDMQGTRYAIEKLKDTSFLDKESPLWRKIALKILSEYATKSEMSVEQAINLDIIIKEENGTFSYNGMCKECKHSQCYAYPASSNMCMNKKSEWYGAFHIDFSLQRFVNGCSHSEKS